MYPIPKLPAPTDNICKFYAIFGILLVITSLTLSILLVSNTNQTIYETVLQQIEDDKLIADDVKKAKLLVQEKVLSTALENRKFGTVCLSIVFTIGIVLMTHGMLRWHREIQPLHDDILRLERQKLIIDRAMAHHEYKEALKASAHKSD
ncbi:hypothetical protein [Neptunomonas phycophila]|uniref:hypothetical protein n=1 Tax=Neptunomonas phycophila TaxID=1572645 RepID=UPI0030FBF07D